MSGGGSDNGRLCQANHVWLLLSHGVDALGDFLAEGNLLFLLADNYRVSDTFAAMIFGVFHLVVAGTFALTAHVAERVPRRGPLGLAAASKVGGIVALGTITMVTAMASSSSPPPPAVWRLVVCIVVLWLIHAPSEAIGMPTYSYAIRRLQRIATLTRDKLYAIDYGVPNQSSCVALGLVTLWRMSAAPPLANIGVYATATGVFALAGLLAGYTHLRLSDGDEPAIQRGREVKDPLDDLLPSCSMCCPWRRADGGDDDDQDAGERGRCRSFALSWFLLSGARFFMIAMAALLPKYIVRRLGDTTFFPLLLAINPAIIGVLSFVTPLVPALMERGRHVHWILAGVTLQLLSIPWLFAGRVGDGWPLMVFIVQATVGELVAWPRVEAWLMSHGQARELPHFRSAVALPGAVLSFLAVMASGVLFDVYCGATATPAECNPLLWLWVLAGAAMTPILLALTMFVWKRF